MAISIAIATYNRSAELVKTLRTLAVMPPACDYEILVVANRCTDDTIPAANAMRPQFGDRLRVIDEPTQGLSRARNRATAEAIYPIVAFLDDDVNVHPRWLPAMESAFASGEFAAVGGRATLRYPANRPHWLDEKVEGYLTKVEMGDDRRAAKTDELFGVNLAIRADWIQRVGGFRTDLGRMGNCLIGDEEGDLLSRIDQAGGKLLYDPAACVEHRVPASRLTRKWFWRRCFDGHRGAARSFSTGQLTNIEVIRAAWRASLSLKNTAVNGVLHGPRSQACFSHSTALASRAGTLVGICARRLKAPAYKSIEVPEMKSHATDIPVANRLSA